MGDGVTSAGGLTGSWGEALGYGGVGSETWGGFRVEEGDWTKRFEEEEAGFAGGGRATRQATRRLQKREAQKGIPPPQVPRRAHLPPCGLEPCLRGGPPGSGPYFIYFYVLWFLLFRAASGAGGNSQARD